MAYDGLDRLTDVASPMYGTNGAHYTHDVLDNLTTVVAPGRNHAYVYDAANRLTNVTSGGSSVIGLGYDAQGNLANKNGQAFHFDFGNRLRAVPNQEQYRYDGHGRRVQAWRPALGNILSQYRQDGTLVFQQNQRTGENIDYVHLAGSLIARHTLSYGAGVVTTEYLHTDALGTPVAVTSANRLVLERSEYEPYGKVLNRPIQDGAGYTGHVEDAATGLINMQQRYYDPGIGMFLSVDPVTAFSTPGSNFNRYWYANNNPYRFIDPDGRQSLTTWPVPGYGELNEADKPREGRGEFGTPRDTSRGKSTHSGIDVKAPVGTPVVAAGDGKVVDIQPNPSETYGDQVVIDHGGGTFTQSAHLDSTSVEPGDAVEAGQQIGTVGRTGNPPKTGDSHLHFEVRKGSGEPRVRGGTVVDPMKELPPPPPPPPPPLPPRVW